MGRRRDSHLTSYQTCPTDEVRLTLWPQPRPDLTNNVDSGNANLILIDTAGVGDVVVGLGEGECAATGPPMVKAIDRTRANFRLNSSVLALASFVRSRQSGDPFDIASNAQRDKSTQIVWSPEPSVSSTYNPHAIDYRVD